MLDPLNQIFKMAIKNTVRKNSKKSKKAYKRIEDDPRFQPYDLPQANQEDDLTTIEAMKIDRCRIQLQKKNEMMY